ncbi:MAG: O-antigen ligase family protein [Herpetosiphonaceae bacterium]|nr:O-antigen ligase family protein [Herpetosiphonaceae bacterium]
MRSITGKFQAVRDSFVTVARVIMATELWVVAGLVALSVASVRVLPWAVLLTAGFWLVRWAAQRSLSIRTPADWPIFALVLLCPITVSITAVPGITREQVFRLLLGIGLYYAVVNWTTTAARLRRLVMSVLAASSGLAMAVPWIVAGPDAGKLPFIPRSLYTVVKPLVSHTINANVMAGALVLFLPLAVALLWFGYSELRSLERLLTASTVLLVGGMLLLTQSRGAFIGVGVALAGLVALRHQRGWLWLVGGALLSAVALNITGSAATVAALSHNPTLGGLDGRLEIWSRAIYIIQDFPLTGIGMGGFQPLVDTTYPLFLMPNGIPHAHNLFLQIAVDLGLPGLIAWLSVVLLVCGAAWHVFQAGRRVGALTTGLGAGLLASEIALLVHGLTDAVTWGMVRTAVLPWALWGLTMAAWRLHGPADQVPDASHTVRNAQ